MSAREIDLISHELAYQEWHFRLERLRLRHEMVKGGLTPELTRLVLERGDGVAAVLHDLSQDALIFVEQFRPGGFLRGQPWLLELPAGMVGAGENPAEAMRRELLEETGYRVPNLEPISIFYLSPGGSSERIFLYYARVTAADRIAEGGGLPAEREDIRLVQFSTAKAFAKMRAGAFPDAKTLIGLQWLSARLKA
jgi:ADP-ribose pyrophosphatase